MLRAEWTDSGEPAEGHDGRCPLERRALLWLFIATTLLYLFTAGSNFSSGDSLAELHVTDSLLSHGWFDVPIQAPGVLCAGWGCKGVDGRFYATHAVGYSIFMIPFYGMAQAGRVLSGAPHCADRFWVRCVPVHLISWDTGLLTAATVVLLALFGLDLGYPFSASLLMALLFGFASMAWPYARYGFDVTLTGLLVLGAVREAAPSRRPGRGRRRWLRAGVLCALAVLVRLPSAIVVVPIAAACWLDAPRDISSRLRRLVMFAGPLAIAAAVTAWYNVVRFGSVINDGHSTNPADRLGAPWSGLAGIALSPGKGLLWYCPLIILAILCVPAFTRAHRATCLLALTTTGISLVPYLFVGDWYGGDAWGPRFVMPVLPLFALPLLELRTFMSTSIRKTLVVVVIMASAAVQLAGLLVDYPDRLALATRRGYGNSIIWDPSHSPILDHVGTLITYLSNPSAAAHPVPQTQTFDIWWLNLWRVDGVPPDASVLAGAVAGVGAAIAVWRLFEATVRLHSHRSRAG